MRTSESSEQIQDVVGADKRRKGFLSRFRRRRTETMPAIKETNSSDRTEVTDIDTDNESFSPFFSPSTYDPSDPLGASYESLPDNILHSCLNLLSSESLDLNRLGLQRLNLLINGRSISDSYRSKGIASYVLVLGGPLGSMEELLRFFFVTMICDSPHNIHSYQAARRTEMRQQMLSEEEEALEHWILEYDPSKGSALDPSEESDDLTNARNHFRDSERTVRHSQGKAEGALHNHALKILAHALSKVYVADSNAIAEIDLDLQGSMWRSIITSLVENIEINHNVNATVYAMRILRILYFVHPTTILPLLKYNLFAYLVDLKDYGERKRLPMVSQEASELLKYTRGK